MFAHKRTILVCENHGSYVICPDNVVEHGSKLSSLSHHVAETSSEKQSVVTCFDCRMFRA